MCLYFHLYLNLQNFRRTEEGVEPCLFQVDLSQVDKLQDGLQVGKTDIPRGKKHSLADFKTLRIWDKQG